MLSTKFANIDGCGFGSWSLEDNLFNRFGNVVEFFVF